MAVPLAREFTAAQDRGTPRTIRPPSPSCPAVACKTGDRASTLSYADYRIGESHAFLYCTEPRMYVNADRNSSQLDPIGAARAPVPGFPPYVKNQPYSHCGRTQERQETRDRNQRAGTRDSFAGRRG